MRNWIISFSLGVVLIKMKRLFICKYLILIFMLSMFFSCKQKNEHEVDCDFAKQQAQNDFKYKKYTWSDFEGFGFDFYGHEEFVEILRKNNIKHKSVGISCMIDGNEKFEHCYEREMNKLLKIKFGANFFDSLQIDAKKEYVMKSKDSIFSFEECDQTSRNPLTNDYSEQFELDNKMFFKNFSYPENYVKRKNEKDYFSYTSTSFILMKDGTTKNFETQSTFQNSKNKTFEKSFNQKVEDFSKRINWKPATIQGIPVNSYMDVTITYQ